MYKVKKEMGTSSNVFLVNEDTMAEINLGRATMTMVYALEKDGHKISAISDDTSCITFRDKWDLEVSTEVASELARLAMPMKKPNRSKKPVEKTEDSKDYADAYEMIFG